MKIGIELKIDVKKIDKLRLFKGEKGTYLTMTTYVDTEVKDQYGSNGFISHKANQNEEKAPILGNSRVFWMEESTPDAPQEANNSYDFDDDEIPF